MPERRIAPTSTSRDCAAVNISRHPASCLPVALFDESSSAGDLFLVVLTDRLELRRPLETDRARFVELFGDHDFMVFSAGVCGTESANARFDEMLRNAAELSYAKQPLTELSTGKIVGYAGVAWFDFEGERRLEFGYRLVPEARGRGYATEAGRAVLALAAESFRGELLAMIDPMNRPSSNVARKLGFTFWKQAKVDDYSVDLYRRVFS